MNMKEMSRRQFYIFAGGIALIFLFTRLWQLGVIPKGIHVDEAGMAYDAWNLVQYGTDRYGNPYPVYLINFDAGQSALYAYLAALCIRIFGFSTAAIRIPAVISSGLLVFAGYFVGKEWRGKRLGLWVAFVLTVCPYYIMASRWGLDCNLLVGFLSFSVWLLILAVRKEKWPWFVLAGLFFGLTLYTYAIAYLLLPIFLALTVIYLFWCRKIRVGQLFALGIPVFFMAVPLFLFLLVNNGLLEEIRTPFFTIPELFYYRGAEFSLKNIPANLKMVKTFLFHDHLDYNASFTYGTLYLISIPLLVGGVLIALKAGWRAIRRKSFSPVCPVLFAAAASAFCAAIVFDGYIINKSNGVFFPLAFFAACGGAAFVEKKWRYGILGAYLILCVGFCSQYFGPMKDHMYQYFEADLQRAASYVREELKPSSDTRIYVDGSDVQQPYIFLCLEEKMTPEEFASSRAASLEEWETHYGAYYFDMPDSVDRNGIYLIRGEGEMADQLRREGFVSEEIGEYLVFYLVN